MRRVRSVVLVFGALMALADRQDGHAQTRELEVDRSLIVVEDDAGGIGFLDNLSSEERRPAVILLQDVGGLDVRHLNYARQIAAAGIALFDIQRPYRESGATVDPDEIERDYENLLRRGVQALRGVPRVDAERIGIMAFGQASRLVYTDAGLPPGSGIRALLTVYPGCGGLAGQGAGSPSGLAPGASIALMHGDLDPLNTPADCRRLADAMARSGHSVRRIEYPGAGYGWDAAPIGGGPGYVVDERVPGRFLRLDFWPELAEYSAAQSASFFWSALQPR